MSLLGEGRPLPLGLTPLEGAEVALKKAQAFLQSPQLGALSPDAMPALREYLDLLQQAVQQGRFAQAAAAFQAQLQQGGGGTPTTIQEPPLETQTAPAVALGGEF